MQLVREWLKMPTASILWWLWIDWMGKARKKPDTCMVLHNHRQQPSFPQPRELVRFATAMQLMPWQGGTLL